MPKHESDQSDYDSDQDNDKFVYKKPQIWRLDKFKNNKKIIINLSTTQYPVVTDVAEDLGWKVQYDMQAGDWDVYWTDIPIDTDTLIKMHLFQKINYYPGIHTLARKNLLGMNLMTMKQRFPNDYNFFPLTWMLPQQYSQFRQYYLSKKQGKTRTYIVKPEAQCQGRGIFLTRNLEDLQNGKHYVVQRYIAKPYLIEGLKFDLRIYVLLCGTSPLRLYIYEDGLARFATEKYVEPTNQNLEQQFMHLTNYAINKRSPKFIFNNSSTNMGIGHKRSLKSTYEHMKKKGMDVDKLKKKINDLIIKTIIAGLPLMAHQYKCCQPEDYSNSMCFHVIGFDVMLDHKEEPQLIQINHTPSFATDTPLDHKIKFGLIKDTLKLMHITSKNKTFLFNKAKQLNQIRLHNKKRLILDGPERQQKILEEQQLRNEYQNKHLGGFTRIYPLVENDSQKTAYYEELMDGAYKMHYAENTPIRIKLEQAQKKKQAEQDIKKMKQITQSKKNKNEKRKNSQAGAQQASEFKRTSTINSREKNHNRQSVGSFSVKKTYSLRESAKIKEKKQVENKSFKNTEEESKFLVDSQSQLKQTSINRKVSNEYDKNVLQRSECLLNSCDKSPTKIVSTSQYQFSPSQSANIKSIQADTQSVTNHKNQLNKVRLLQQNAKFNQPLKGLPKMLTSIERQLTRKESQEITRSTKTSSITDQIFFNEKNNFNNQIPVSCKEILSELFSRQKSIKNSQKSKEIPNQSELPNIYDQSSQFFTEQSPKKSDSFKIRSSSKNQSTLNPIVSDIKYMMDARNKKQSFKPFSNDKKINQIPQLNRLVTRKINFSHFKGNNSNINPQPTSVIPNTIVPGGFVVPKMYQLNVQSEKRIQTSQNILSMISRKNVNKNIFPI